MADAVQERIEREQRFASDVSHELRSPITALTAAVEVLDARRDDLPDRTRQALDVVVEPGAPLRRHGDRPARAVAARRRRHRPATPRTSTSSSCAIGSRSATATADLPIEVHRRAKRRALVDRVRFERILGNLLENATTHGGGPMRITIEPSPVKTRC